MEEAFDKFGIDILPDFWSGINREDYNTKFNAKKIEQDKKKPQLKKLLQKKYTYCNLVKLQLSKRKKWQNKN